MADENITREYAHAVPLNAISAFGLGPFGARGERRERDLSYEATSQQGLAVAYNTSGLVVRQLVELIWAHGGRMDAEQLRAQTAPADPALLSVEIERAVVARLFEDRGDGSVELGETFSEYLAPFELGLTDTKSLTSDAMGAICRNLGVENPIPTRKAERVAAIIAAFDAPGATEGLEAKVGPVAWKLFHDIVDSAGTGIAHASSVGIHGNIHAVGPSPFSNRISHEGATKALHDLACHGLIGVESWEGQVWIWAEAYRVLGRPIYRDWSMAPRPTPVRIDSGTAAVPEVVTAMTAALEHWDEIAPKVLKNDEPRLAKAAVAALARTTGVSTTTAELLSGVAINHGLLLRNVTGASGRGRNRRVDAVWRPDPQLVEVWKSLSTAQRWALIVSGWSSPVDRSHRSQLQVNRHLVAWELADLEPGLGFDDTATFGQWLGDHYCDLGHCDAVAEVIEELRVLGLVPAQGAFGFTDVARALLADPASAEDAFGGSVDEVIVQPDMTIVVPPDLDAELASRLREISVVDSEGAVTVLRLDETRITKRCQAGTSAEDIVGFLADVSSVELSDGVIHLVRDAADKANRVSILEATSLVVTADPGDLQVAMSLKSAKLTKVADTVAISPLTPARLRQALDRRDLHPKIVTIGEQPAARTASDEAEVLARRAEELRRYVARSPNRHTSAIADRLDQNAAELADVGGRLTVSGPLVLTPDIVEGV
ncbi:MAG: hypothetical protein GY708_06735 [Actinomycetia bacterium]|nr:hypothetical protein [Actinomycetes bacterium]MCP4962527.1 hypothetical protein [Actinomycetes bacterium]